MIFLKKHNYWILGSGIGIERQIAGLVIIKWKYVHLLKNEPAEENPKPVQGVTNLAKQKRLKGGILIAFYF